MKKKHRLKSFILTTVILAVLTGCSSAPAGTNDASNPARSTDTLPTQTPVTAPVQTEPDGNPPETGSRPETAPEEASEEVSEKPAAGKPETAPQELDFSSINAVKAIGGLNATVDDAVDKAGMWDVLFDVDFYVKNGSMPQHTWAIAARSF